jgi:hypothetical protein
MQSPRARVKKSKSNQQSLIIIVLVILTVAAVVLNIVLGMFYRETTISTVTITSTVNLDAFIEGREEMLFLAEDLQAGNLIPKTLKVETEEDTEECYIRIKTSFKVNGVSNSNIFMLLDVGDEDWELQSGVDTSGWFYYKYILMPSELHFVHMVFNIKEDIPSKYIGEKLTAHIEVEVLSTVEDYYEWDNLPLDWPHIA